MPDHVARPTPRSDFGGSMYRFRQSKPALVLCSLLMLLAMGVAGQTVNSSLTAIVADKTGAVIPNANVTLTNNASGDIRRSTTNSEGYFSINGIFPGSYSV